MCDPVTMSAVSATMSTVGGSMAASSTGWIASMGTGMINTASLFNMSSAYGSLGGSLSASAAGYGTSLGSGIVSVGSSILKGGNLLMGGLQVGSGAAEAYAQKQIAEMEMQKYEIQKKQYKAELERIEIEGKAEELDRRKRYNAMLSENRTHMAVSGVSVASASYKALLESNRDQYLNDVSYTKLITDEKTLGSSYGFKEADTAQKTVRRTTPTKQFITLASRSVDAYKLLREKPSGA